MKSNFIKILIPVCAGFLIILASFMAIYKNSDTANKNESPTSSNSLNMSFSEVSMTDEDIVNSSDLIVRGKFLKVKEKSISKAQNKNTNKIASGNESPEPAEVEIPYVVYEFKVSENLENDTDKLNSINVVMVDANVGLGNFDDLLKNNDEYVLFLHKNQNDTYTLVSYSDGIRKLKVDTNEFETISKKTSKYDNLKATVKLVRVKSVLKK